MGVHPRTASQKGKVAGAAMEADPAKACNQDDATGFIRLNALRLKVAAEARKKE